MAEAGAPSGRMQWDAALCGAAGVLVIAGWFFPWFTLHFGASALDASSALVESPYGQATGDPAGQSTWTLLIIGVVLLGLGIYLAAHTRRSRTDAVLQTAGAFLLASTIYQVLGLMAVLNFITGKGVAPGAYLVPQIGWFITLLGVLVCAAASVQAWRQSAR